MTYIFLGVVFLQFALICGSGFIIFYYGVRLLSRAHFDVPFLETPRQYLPVIADALDIQRGDVVYDLGSGDGRVILYLADRFPEARFVGVERNPFLFLLSRFRARGISNAVVVRANFFNLDFTNATKIYGYLETRPLNELYSRGKLHGVRLVSRAFLIQSETPTSSIRLSERDGAHGEHMLHIYNLATTS
ncbi:MAG: hypothetical protein WA021_02585 [Minisyncoccia bacterium]